MKIGLQTWGSEGDIRPFLALAGGLRARGHQVSLVITSVDGKDYSSYGREMDFPVSHVGTFPYDDQTMLAIEKQIVRETNSMKQVDIIAKYFFDPVIDEMYAAAERLARDHDAVVGHFFHHPAHAAAEKAGKPYATVMMTHMGVYSKHNPVYGVPNLGKWMTPYWWKIFHFMMDRTRGVTVNELRKRVGLRPIARIAETVWISKKLNLVAETTVLNGRQPDWADHHHVCGFFALPSRAESWTMPDDLKAFLEAGPRPVFMTLGSMFVFDTSPEIIAGMMIKAALNADCRAIIQAPWDTLPPMPDDPRIYKILKVPHKDVFPRCAAVVHHGGAGTTHTALLHGCPSIVIEHIADQTFFAGELHRLGVAPEMLHRRTVTAKKLAKAIRTVLDDPAMKKRAEELSRLMQKENGVERASQLIEKYCSPA